MKKMYLITAIALFTLGSCQQKEKEASESEAYTTEDTTQVTQSDVVDSTAVNSTSDVQLADTISEKTTTRKVDNTKGKYELATTKWQLIELNGKEVNNKSDKPYLLTLNSKSGKFSSYVGCNNIMGSYVMKEANMLAFLYVGATKMACASMDFETKYTTMLPKVDNYMIEGSMLHLHRGKKALAKFEAVQ